MTCGQKKTYINKKQAWRAAFYLFKQGIQQYPYTCPSCKLFHLSKKANIAWPPNYQKRISQCISKKKIMNLAVNSDHVIKNKVDTRPTIVY